MTQQDATAISGYHAHVYYDPADRAPAERLREAIEERFEVRMGRWHDRPIGPHPQASYQVAFGTELFESLVPWLILNRGNLTVLLHPLTGDDLADHRDFATWLGPSDQLDLSIFNSR